MNNNCRLFLVFEGEDNSYPNFSKAKIHLVKTDPAAMRLNNLFVCSPLFILSETEDIDEPNIEGAITISFIMVPEIFPCFHELKKKFGITNKIWFTLGLANLVVIEENGGNLSQEIIQFLKDKRNIIAHETWNFQNRVLTGGNPVGEIIPNGIKYEEVQVQLSEQLPLHLKFAVSEYIISVNKFLTASYKFTPQYYERHLSTVKQTIDLIDDISFLTGDTKFTPTAALLKTLNARNKEEAIKTLKDTSYSITAEEILNERHGMIVQFNSSMSYIYSQQYSGTFPLLDHFGIIRRHSLLGVGTAISALFELIIQLEEALFYSPFEDLSSTQYVTKECSNEAWYKFFHEPSLFETEYWSSDSVRGEIVKESLKTKPSLNESEFFNRLSFFSGRLGFREYEFSATAAIQVLVESHRLKWNIINYTHEIIHNHVRILLSQLIPPKSQRNDEEFEQWIERYRHYLKELRDGQSLDFIKSISYKDYFILVLIKFIVNSSFYGSLSEPSDLDKIDNLRVQPGKTSTLLLPLPTELKLMIQNLYKDISEIFVHVIDFTYIYNRNIETYLLSIWLSWSTIPAVTNDIKQYILRSLIVIGIFEKGNLKERFESSIKRFEITFETIKSKNLNDALYNRVRMTLDNDTEKRDLQFRFYNCIIVGNLTYDFFITDLEAILDNDDENRLPKESKDEEGNLISYYIETNSFEGKPIKSKVRFLLDQLEREIANVGETYTDNKVEYTSAWLLLSLSSFYQND